MISYVVPLIRIQGGECFHSARRLVGSLNGRANKANNKDLVFYTLNLSLLNPSSVFSFPLNFPLTILNWLVCIYVHKAESGYMYVCTYKVMSDFLEIFSWNESKYNNFVFRSVKNELSLNWFKRKLIRCIVFVIIAIALDPFGYILMFIHTLCAVQWHDLPLINAGGLWTRQDSEQHRFACNEGNVWNKNIIIWLKICHLTLSCSRPRRTHWTEVVMLSKIVTLLLSWWVNFI